MSIENGFESPQLKLLVSNAAEVAKVRKKSRIEKRNKLSHDQVRKNHVVSEQRRRELVRGIYDDLVEIVPGLERSERRSEFLIYLKTINHLKWLYKRNVLLREKLREKYELQGRSNVAIPSWLIWELPQTLADQEANEESPSMLSK